MKIAEKLEMIAGILAAIAAIASIAAVSINLFLPEKKEAGLSTRIIEVEAAIKNLRNLENYLEKSKQEMEATKQAKDKIEEEYNKAKELQKLTDLQIEAISLAVNKRTKTEVIINYFWGFVLGLASSLLASYVYGMIKRKKKGGKSVTESLMT